MLHTIKMQKHETYILKIYVHRQYNYENNKYIIFFYSNNYE